MGYSGCDLRCVAMFEAHSELGALYARVDGYRTGPLDRHVCVDHGVRRVRFVPVN